MSLIKLLGCIQRFLSGKTQGFCCGNLQVAQIKEFRGSFFLPLFFDGYDFPMTVFNFTDNFLGCVQVFVV